MNSFGRRVGSEEREKEEEVSLWTYITIQVLGWLPAFGACVSDIEYGRDLEKGKMMASLLRGAAWGGKEVILWDRSTHFYTT